MDFILMPDSVSASALRQKLAEQQTLGVQVGTFTGLLDAMQNLFLLPAAENDFDQQLRQVAIQNKNAFWAKSIVVDEQAVLKQLNQSLRFILSLLPINKAPALPVDKATSREENYYQDLYDLWQQMGKLYPSEQTLAKNGFAQKDLPGIEPLHLSYYAPAFSLTNWQQDLLALLQQKAKPNPQWDALLKTFFQKSLQQDNAISAFSRQLFSADSELLIKQKPYIKIIRFRDALQEVEGWVSHIQQQINNGVKAEDIAIVVPNEQDYIEPLIALLNQAGILCSYQQAQNYRFQWEKQLIKDLLQCYYEQNCNNRIPKMLMAAILANPVMPWSIKQGQLMAQKHIDGRKAKDVLTQDEHLALFTLLAQPQGNVFDWLAKIIQRITQQQKKLPFSANALHDYILELKEQHQLYQADSPAEALQKLIAQILPAKVLQSEATTKVLLNGVKILLHNQWLLEPVSSLFVLGFNQGNYQPANITSGVFSQQGSFAEEVGLQQNRQQSAFKQQFKNLIAQAKDRVYLSFSAFDQQGESLQASESLLEIARVLQAGQTLNPDALILQAQDCPQIIPQQQQAIPKNTPTSGAIKTALQLDRDLLALNQQKDGSIKPQSPSSLEKMMVSPLAWLLSEQGFDAQGWFVEKLDVLLLGTIAHKVFELYFQADNPDFDSLFEKALQSEASFLLDNFWRIEREQLKQEMQAALPPFSQWCQLNDWQIIQTEQRLSGKLWGIPLKGFADAVLQKEGKYLILDYKKSKSKDRIKRLKAGYDLQTRIYSELYRQSRKKTASVSSGYYTLNDQTLIIDINGGEVPNQLNLKVLENQQHQLSANAVNEIKQRLRELRQGIVQLNREDDASEWDKKGVKAQYTLENAPIVQFFYTGSE